ncbi:MAG: threonine aldolase family protein [Burkholderiales bacterium]|jgi:threonine aldolase
MPLRAEEQDALRRRCTVVVSGHGEAPPGAELARVAAWCREHGWHADRYGEGALIGGFEAKLAALLGKPAAVFMPSGTMAQQIALRVACERTQNFHIAMHPTSHLELHEEHAYARLHSLRASFLGERERPTHRRDLAELAAHPAALLVELPAREIGGRLPAWSELAALSALARERGIWRHMDGARLWEAREYYAPASHADLAAQFDSVYVSFYKGIGALAGAMLLGPEDFIAQARVWRRRHGGTLVQLHPFVASAAMRFDDQLAKMAAYRARAADFAQVLADIDGLAVEPHPPQVNLFHLHCAAPAEALTAARDCIADEYGAWLAPRFVAGRTPETASAEIYVGDSLLAMERNDDRAVLAPLYARLLGLARAAAARASPR